MLREAETLYKMSTRHLRPLLVLTWSCTIQKSMESSTTSSKSYPWRGLEEGQQCRPQEETRGKSLRQMRVKTERTHDHNNKGLNKEKGIWVWVKQISTLGNSAEVSKVSVSKLQRLQTLDFIFGLSRIFLKGVHEEFLSRSCKVRSKEVTWGPVTGAGGMDGSKPSEEGCPGEAQTQC